MHRDDLVAKIRDFEECEINPKEIIMSPSPEVKYQCNLMYLGKLCELISEKYNREFVSCEDKDNENYLFKIRDFLDSKGFRDESTLNNQIEEHKEGKKY